MFAYLKKYAPCKFGQIMHDDITKHETFVISFAKLILPGENAALNSYM